MNIKAFEFYSSIVQMAMDAHLDRKDAYVFVALVRHMIDNDYRFVMTAADIIKFSKALHCKRDSLENSLKIIRSNPIITDKHYLRFILTDNVETWTCPLVSHEVDKARKISNLHKIAGQIGGKKSGAARKGKAELKKIEQLKLLTEEEKARLYTYAINLLKQQKFLMEHRLDTNSILPYHKTKFSSLLDDISFRSQIINTYGLGDIIDERFLNKYITECLTTDKTVLGTIKNPQWKDHEVNATYILTNKECIERILSWYMKRENASQN